MSDLKFYKQNDGSLASVNNDNSTKYVEEQKINRTFVYDIKNKKFLNELKEGKLDFGKFILKSPNFNIQEFGAKIATYFYEVRKYDDFIAFEDLLKRLNPMDLRTTEFKNTQIDSNYLTSISEASSATIDKIEQKLQTAYQSLFKNYPLKTIEELKEMNLYNSEEQFAQGVKKHLQIQAFLTREKNKKTGEENLIINFVHSDFEPKFKRDKENTVEEKVGDLIDKKMKQNKQSNELTI